MVLLLESFAIFGVLGNLLIINMKRPFAAGDHLLLYSALYTTE